MAADAVVCPSPLMTLTKPRGIPACSRILTSAVELNGVNSDGFNKTAFPAQMAGAICQPPVKIGAFQGVI